MVVLLNTDYGVVRPILVVVDGCFRLFVGFVCGLLLELMVLWFGCGLVADLLLAGC